MPPSYVVEDYLNETGDLTVLAGAIVSGSFQGFDQEYLLKALKPRGSTFYDVPICPLQGRTNKFNNPFDNIKGYYGICHTNLAIIALFLCYSVYKLPEDIQIEWKFNSLYIHIQGERF